MASLSGNPPQHVASLTKKLYDPDPDHRYMSLSDLHDFLKTSSPTFLASDYSQCNELIDGFLHTLNDTNGEVQNLTIKCMRPFVLKCIPDILLPLIHKVSVLKLDQDVDGSVVTMALRTIVSSLPRPTTKTPRSKSISDAYTAISRILIPRLVGYLVVSKSDPSLPKVPVGLLQQDIENGGQGNAIEILTEIAKSFGPMLQPAEVKALQSMSMQLFEAPRSTSITKKKAITGICALSHFFTDGLLSGVLGQIMEKLKNVHITSTARKFYFNLLGAMAKSIPTKFGPYLKQLAPFVISELSQQEVDERMEEDEEQDYSGDEMREAAITALESFYASCAGDMQRFNKECVDALLRFLRYDPTLADHYDEDVDQDNQEDESIDLDEDFEQEDVPDDEDDVSWKVRRSAAKTLQTVIAAKSKDLLENWGSFERIAKALLDRFKEREESVRIEVVSTTSFLVQRSKHADAEFDRLRQALDSELTANQRAGSRKRRRAGSDINVAESAKYRRLTGSESPTIQTPSPTGGPSNLAKMTPEIMRSSLNLAINGTPKTKVVSVILLKDVVIAWPGAAADMLQDLFGLISASIHNSNTADLQISSQSSSSVYVESLQLLNEIVKSTSSQILQPHIVQIIPIVCQIAQGKGTQLACEALQTIEQLVKALTPPRAGSNMRSSTAALAKIVQTLMMLISNKASDLQVRQQAVSVVGTLLGRTFCKEGSRLLDQKQRNDSLQVLSDACQNETIRYTAIRAIDTMAVQAPDGVSLPKEWFTALCAELGKQLRKQDRSLCGASLQALRTLIVERNGTKNLKETSRLADQLIPVLSSGELHQTGLALLVLGVLLRDGSSDIMSSELVKSVCELTRSPDSATVIDQISFFMDCVGQRKAGKDLMQALLKDVGVAGIASVVGKVIGDLLTSSGGSAGIDIDAFLKELQTATDDRRKCLALSVIGEYGLRLGSSASLEPDLFLPYLETKEQTSEVPIAAAVALGRAAAGAGNVKKFTPVIISRVTTNSSQLNVWLHGMKEVLLYVDDVSELTPFLKKMWDAALGSAKDDICRTVGAECLSKIAELEPETYLQNLQALLFNQGEYVRLLCIVALRDLFTHTDVSYNKYLRPIFSSTLDHCLRDTNPENRRNALNTFSTAARTKPELTLQHLTQLLPIVLDQTVEDPALVREVSIGPFKQRVDDGLEARKSAFETIYSLLEQSTQTMMPMLPKLLQRVVAGLGDEPTIRQLCIHMLLKLAPIAPEETYRSLDDVADQFRRILDVQLKDGAVRTEVEKDDEAKKTAVKVSVQLNRIIGNARSASGGTQPDQGGVGFKWHEYIEGIRGEYAQLYKEEEKTLRSRGL